jgi:outer membrane lipoprotein-sorting protein
MKDAESGEEMKSKKKKNKGVSAEKTKKSSDKKKKVEKEGRRSSGRNIEFFLVTLTFFIFPLFKYKQW